MAMVVRANRQHAGIGGHISTFASSATLYEVGFNHFFRAKSAGHPGDMVFLPGPRRAGYLCPGLSGGSDYRVADGKFSAGIGRGRWPEFISASVSHARLLAVSHRLHGPVANHGHLPGPLQPLYGRPGIKPPDDRRVWAFLGDGETDEPETLGAITLAAREQLDNLIFVINCNLQRLDGPVRGNGKIIQELEAAFRGCRLECHQGDLGR
jgi:pyruvate dehydrogenase E1 component